MLRPWLAGQALVALLCTISAHAYTIDSISFGHNGQISPNGRAIPNWHVSGEGHTPQILSDRIILTPPAPGGTRGALWSETGSTQQYWTADISFRASGQDRGSGNLQIWFIKDGRSAVETNSVYTVGRFEGLALVVDQHGGRGMLRGFLNDGATSYKDHHNTDSLAFGHCDFAYRNLGRPSRVGVTNDAHGFSVTIDDQPCFSSNKVTLPTGYFFGVSAATADNPDSFEVNHFVLSTTSAISRDEPRKNQQQEQQQQQQQQQQQDHHESHHEQHNLPNAPEQLADRDAASIKRQDEQFADVHNRLQGLSHQVNQMFSEFEKITQTMDDRHRQIVDRMPRIPDDLINTLRVSSDALGTLNRRMEGIERTMQVIRKDVEGKDYKEHFSNLQQAVEGVRGGLSESLPDTLSQSMFRCDDHNFHSY